MDLHGYVNRELENEVGKALSASPAVAVLGPRQCGKSTLASKIIEEKKGIYLDLQDRADLNKLNEPELFFEQHRNELVCLDEVQLAPHLFSYLRSEIDKKRKAGRFLLLGSASRDLIQKSTETLAGRIRFLNLTPFLKSEIINETTWQNYWLRGGFPESIFSINDEDSFHWKINFIRTFLERDIPQLGYSIPVPIMTKLWTLLSHLHGQIMNYNKLAEAANISVPTLKKYLALLEQTYMIRTLTPYSSNLKKRMVKSPKVYIRDSGILHTLQNIETYDDLLANPIIGSSWEGHCIENIIMENPKWNASFARSSNGAEVDLILERAGKIKLFEFKTSKEPKLSRGFYEFFNTLNPLSAEIIAPVDEPYQIKKGIWVRNV